MDGLVKERGGQEGKEKGKRPLPLHFIALFGIFVYSQLGG